MEGEVKGVVAVSAPTPKLHAAVMATSASSAVRSPI
jgi:hypothetical protein